MIWLNLENKIIHRFLKLEIYEDSNTLLGDKNVLTNRKITFIRLFLYACFAGKLIVTVTELSMNKEDKDAVVRYRKLVDNILKPLR
jgi:hypothetical protein